MLGVAISLGLLAILLLWRRPWKGRDGLSKWLAPIPGLLLGLVALLGLSEGLPEFLQARGLFLDVDSRGPRSMVVFDGGFVLAGDDGEKGLLWLSDDGSSWNQIEDPIFDGVLLLDLVVVEDGLLVVAAREDPSEAVIFSSPDGMQWQLAAAFGNRDHGTAPIAMSESAETLVVMADIVGNDIEFYRGTDAVTWTAAEPTPEFDDGESGRDIACSDRLCVAVGFHDATYRNEIDANTGVAWVSTTGTSYNLVDHNFAAERLEAIAWADPGFIAVGNTPSNKGVAWLSQDGESWTSLKGPFNNITITGVTATSDTYIIFGHDPDTGGLEIWTSTTGDQWSEEIISNELAEGSQIRTVVDRDGTRIAAGIASDTLDTLIWTSTNNQPWQHSATIQTSP